MRTIAIFLALISLNAFAQLPALPTLLPDEKAVRARISELTPPDKGLPAGTIDLVTERGSVANELQTLRGINDRKGEFAGNIEAIANVKATVSGAISTLASIECTKVTSSPIAAINVIANAHFSLQSKGVILFNEPDSPWAAAPFGPAGGVTPSPSSVCAQWKSFVGDANQQAALINYYEKLANRVQNEAKQQGEYMLQVAKLVELLQNRRDAIDKRVSTQEAKSQLADRLWLLIAAIGALSIATIMAVKLFSDDIQLEWVASGQVIQFVTVMILLSVILALGLAEILKENILGTLLGGIGGYVLAQGVGRAAAREVSRGRDKGAAPRTDA